MKPTCSDVFEDVISKPRLNSYKGYFATKNIDEAIGFYMWNCELSSCFSAIFSFFEITLRNKVHRAMSQHYGTVDSYHWYDDPKSKLNKAKVKVDDLRTKRVNMRRNMSPDEIVSGMSFGFWSNVLGAIDPPNIIFPKIFPSHPMNKNPRDWQNKRNKTRELAFIYELNEFRNRIAHYEPLWKFSAIKDTSVSQRPTVIVPESNNLDDSLLRFKRLLKFLDDAMEAMHIDFYIDLTQSSWRKRLDYLLSNDGVTRYRTLGYCASCPICLTPSAR